MTPLQMAKRFCANYKPEGCLGMWIDVAGSTVKHRPMWTKKTQCVLAQEKRRCKYFEECVMPINIDDSHVELKSQVGHAVEQYRLMSNLGVSGDGRECPYCGQLLPPRKKLCHVCARARRLATFRARRDRKAKAGV